MTKSAKPAPRMIAFLLMIECPDIVPDGSEPSFVLPEVACSMALQPYTQLTTVLVDRSGLTAGQMLAALTGDAKHDVDPRPAMSTIPAIRLEH